ncbi:MAG: iron ABC transporter permease [Thermoflavifilum sp.]|nr:iron ABC transporter permease [Thermoflavifilum sp.]MCL6514390.1 iron ABC transporter permease [Alicyclobacillus sp.]
MSRRRRTGLIGLFLLLCIAAWVEISWGPVSIPIRQIGSQTWAYLHGSRDADAVVMGAIRWPRLCAAILVGAGLAVSGCVLQAVFRNSMADPGIIGVSSGGALGAVLAISLGLGAVSPWLPPLCAFALGLAAVLAVYRLGSIGGRTAVHSLLLSGVAVSSLCSAIVTLLLSLVPFQTMAQMMFWLMGGLDGITWVHVAVAGSAVLVGLVVFIAMAPALDIISIGEEQAEGVGVHLERVRRVAMLVSALVVGACVSISGVIGFVGLIVPHLLRLWFGAAHRVLIPVCALGGAVLLTLSDVIARMALSPVELNIGIVTSCLGAPFFLYLLRRQYARGAWG